HLSTQPFAEQHAIAGLQVDGNELSGLVASARADGHNLTLLGLLLGSVRNDDPTGGLFLSLAALEHRAIMEGNGLHGITPAFCSVVLKGMLATRGKLGPQRTHSAPYRVRRCGTWRRWHKF